MALRLTDKKGRPDPRRIEPAEAADLRAIRAAGLAVQADNLCFALLQYAHRRGLRIECDCRGEGAEAPVSGIRRQRNGAYSLFNLANARGDPRGGLRLPAPRPAARARRRAGSIPTLSIRLRPCAGTRKRARAQTPPRGRLLHGNTPGAGAATRG